MSLITLSSQRNTSVQRDTDPAIIKNYFKDGIRLREGTEVALVSLTINKLDLYEIVTGENDTLIWRIGNAQNFLQHTVIINGGNYNGTQLAIEIALRLNNSTIIGVYYNNWTCVFDQTAQKGAGAFTINYGQTETPLTPNENTLTMYSGGTPVFQNNGTNNISIKGSANGQVSDFNDIVSPLIITGNKGIFGNEGEFSLITRPQEGFTELSQANGLKSRAVEEVYYNAGVPETRSLTFVDTSGTEETNGWILEGNTTPVGNPIFMTYFGEGEWGLAEDGSIVSTRANIIASGGLFVFYNPSRGVFADADNGGRHLGLGLVGSFYQYEATPHSFALPIENIGIGVSNTGYVRNYLYNGRTDYPTTPTALIKDDPVDGFDVMVQVQDNDNYDGAVISLSQLKQQAGVGFPNTGWRNNSAFIFNDIDPTTEFETLPTISGVRPANWTTYNYPVDHIKARIEIVNLLKVNIYLSHDTAGDNTFIEEILVRRTGDNNGFNSTIQEKLYPLRPCISISRGNQYYSSRYISNGIYDENEIINPTIDASGNVITHEFAGETIDESETDFKSSSSATDLTLSALFKYGDVFNSDVPPLAIADITPTGNINYVIGFDRYYIFAAGNASNSVTSSSEPITTIREPTLSVELPDFNIKGFNGNTGDNMKVIAVVPKEELQTNEKTGTLHYYPAFPVFIDLNLPQEQIYYDLNAILRLPSGRVANDLLNPTEMTLLFKEGDESKQKRMLKNQTEMFASMLGNIQGAKINMIGHDFPRI
tara:strand:+ start:1838 stop:4132 length:2295 start_codon:yes stop_codon:yes gene_type:complete